MKKSLSRIVLAVLLVASFNNRAFAWGPVGHETIAYIAEDNLTSKAKAAVIDLLDQGDDMASVSNWADKIRFEAKATAPWHFINLPLRENLTLEAVESYAADHPCIVSALQKETEILKNTNETRLKRQEALKFVIHFVGDIHQPFHCFDDNDRGGNDKIIRFKTPGRRGRGTKMKLHQLWDELIKTLTVENPRTYASDLEKSTDDNIRKVWELGTFEDWAFDSWGVGKRFILPDLIANGMGPGPGDYSSQPLPVTYYDFARPIVDNQIRKAGYRLAWLLNDIFK